MQYAITHIASLINAHITGPSDGNVTTLLTDSRSLCFPEETLFFALVSKRGDGHRYISELYARGVRNFVVSATPAAEHTIIFVILAWFVLYHQLIGQCA